MMCTISTFHPRPSLDSYYSPQYTRKGWIPRARRPMETELLYSNNPAIGSARLQKRGICRQVHGNSQLTAGPSRYEKERLKW